MRKNDCCAILVNFFGADETAEAAHSLSKDAPDAQILIVDNSADADEFTRLTKSVPASARILNAGANLGFGRACNLAWVATEAPYVFFINPDVRILPGCTEALVQVLESDTSLAAVAPRQYLDSKCQWQLPPAWLPTAVRSWSYEAAMRHPQYAKRLARAQRAENFQLWTARSPVVQRALSGGALMLRRSALGGLELPFDPGFFMYFEDSDLCLRLRRRGRRMAVVPDATAVHSWRNLPHKAPLMERSASVYFEKHWPAGQRHWLERAEALIREPFTLPPGGWQYEAVVDSRVAVPAFWHKGWMLELSPSPMMQPAIGCIGSGPEVFVDSAVLDAFCGAPVFGRLSGVPLDDICKAMLLRWF